MSELKLEWHPPGKGRREGRLVARWGQDVFTDTLDITKAGRRERLVNTLAERWPALGDERDQMQRELERLAADEAERQPEGSQPGAPVLAGRAVKFPVIEPWPEPVDGRELLDGFCGVFKRQIVLPEGGAEAAALWILHTWLMDVWQESPFLAFVSPTKRCGKTRALLLLSYLTPRRLFTSNSSPAALFRTVERWTPTLLVDELDSQWQNDELRGILNAGHTRDAAYVLRCVGDEFEPRQFSVWAAKALGLIGRLPATLEDRAIVIAMKRKLPTEAVERLGESHKAECKTLARKAARWTADNKHGFVGREPEFPADLHDRAADCWRPLLAIAEAVGGDWGGRARHCALLLSRQTAEDADVGEALLRDIRTVFHDRETERIRSEDLCEGLAEIEGGRWREWRTGKPLSPNGLARLLSRFGIKPRNVRAGEGGKVCKGYMRADFEDAFSRYLPPEGEANRYTATRLKSQDLHDASGEKADGDVAVSCSSKSCDINDVAAVAVGKAPWEIVL